MKRIAGAASTLAALCILLAFLSPVFPTVQNLTNVLMQACVTAVLAAGMSMVIFSGGIDLSVGSVLALSAALTAGAMKADVPVPLAIFIGLLAGTALGAGSGAMIAWLRLPPFIATLGMMGIARGLAYVYLGGAPLFTFPASYRAIAEGRLGGLPAPVWLMLAVFLVMHVVATRTAFGRAVYAIGGNEEAARLAGIPIKPFKVLIYSLCGLLSGLAGIILSSRLDSAEPQAGDGYELDAIAAAVMGGASLSGGEGTIVGSLVGALIMGVVRNGLNLLNVSAYWQKVVIGGIILLAVLVDSMRRRER